MGKFLCIWSLGFPTEQFPQQEKNSQNKSFIALNSVIETMDNFQSSPIQVINEKAFSACS